MRVKSAWIFGWRSRGHLHASLPGGGGRVFSCLLAMVSSSLLLEDVCCWRNPTGFSAAMRWEQGRSPWKSRRFGKRRGLGGILVAEVRHRLLRYALHNLLFLKVFFLPKERRVAGSQPQLQAAVCLADALLSLPCRFLTEYNLSASCGALGEVPLPMDRDRSSPSWEAASLPVLRISGLPPWFSICTTDKAFLPTYS